MQWALRLQMSCMADLFLACSQNNLVMCFSLGSVYVVCLQGSGWGWLGYSPELKRLIISTTANQDPLSTQVLSAVACSTPVAHLQDRIMLHRNEASLFSCDFSIRV